MFGVKSKTFKKINCKIQEVGFNKSLVFGEFVITINRNILFVPNRTVLMLDF